MLRYPILIDFLRLNGIRTAHLHRSALIFPFPIFLTFLYFLNELKENGFSFYFAFLSLLFNTCRRFCVYVKSESSIPYTSKSFALLLSPLYLFEVKILCVILKVKVFCVCLKSRFSVLTSRRNPLYVTHA